jgi:Short C-terminal domain
MKKVNFQKARYLGGLPGDRGGFGGRLMIDDNGIGVGAFNPKAGIVAWGDMAGISFDSDTASKSRAGKALLVGVFALAAKKTQKQAVITVNLKDGNTTLYEVTGKSGQAVRGKIQPFLIEHGVPCLDDAPAVVPVPPATATTADELMKLAELHAAGALTGEEFAAAKARLLS